MKKIILTVALICASAATAYAEETGADPVLTLGKYNFKMYVLAKGSMKKNTDRPDFGWRILKTLPLRVKEFTYPAPFMENNAPEFKAAAESVLASIEEPRRKNACRVADAVFEYVETSITAREVLEEISDNPHKIYLSALQVLRGEKAVPVEKCRLAVAMLRYFTIPARIVNRDGGYEVEYFIQPLSEHGKGGWYLRGFNGKAAPGGEYLIPADWHPIDARELLNVEWQGSMYIKLKKQARSFPAGDEEAVQSAFAALTETGKNIEGKIRPKSGSFYVIYDIDYELWLDYGTVEARAEFTLPFNIPDDFKTIKYYVKTFDERFWVKAKWPQTKTKPSQDGIIYTLPVSFKVIKP